MPLFSEHIANMYYGSSSPYTGLPYSYSSSISPLGSSYSASYLNPGGSYSSHSSIGGYSRAPLTSRWITSSGRNYAPMLSTISERGSASPVRINSPRRLPYSTRTYGTSNFTPRPVNINTADIDVSRDRYRHKAEPPTPQPPPPKPTPPSPPRKSSSDENQNGPFMPRVDGKPETGIDSSPGVPRSTIKRGRTVVRLYTIKRKERDSPRKPTEEQQTTNDTNDKEAVENKDDEAKKDDKEFMKWREKLSDDLVYKEKKEKKTLGTKLMEKFVLKDDNDKNSEIPTKVKRQELQKTESAPTTPAPSNNYPGNNISDRRCSVELLAEQCNLLDSLIRSENLSTGTLDLSKMGVVEDNKTGTFESLKGQNLSNPLKTTKSDYSLHDSLKSYKDVRDPKNFKRRSIKKSSSGSNLRRLDSITEFPKELTNLNLPAIEESRTSVKQENTKQKPKPKLKTKITSSVEVSAPMSPLKFVVENITVEEKPRIPRKGITYSSEVEEVSNTSEKNSEKVVENKDKINVKKPTKDPVSSEKEPSSPESPGVNFWDTIGKRETVYLKKRKQNIDDAKETHKRSLFWFPEEEESENSRETESNKIQESISVSTSITNGSNEISNLKQEPLLDKAIDIVSNQSSQIMLIDADILTHQQAKELKTGKETTIPVPTETSINSSDSATAINKIIDKVNDNTKLTNQPNDDKIKVSAELPKQPVIEADTSQTKIIGKSASLDTINENKVKVPSQKKTKSEKIKKAIKTIDKSDIKQLQPLLPKSNVKVKLSEKSKIEVIPKDSCKKQVTLQNKVVDIEKVQNNISDIKAIIDDTAKNADKPKIPCPVHPFGIQKTKEIIAESKINMTVKLQDNINHEHEATEKSIKDVKQKETSPIHPSVPQKVKETNTLQPIIPLNQKDLPECKRENITTTALKENSVDNRKVINDVLLPSENPSISDLHSKIEEIKVESGVNKIQVIIQSSSAVKSSESKSSKELLKPDKTDLTNSKLSTVPSDVKETSIKKINSKEQLNKVGAIEPKLKTIEPKVTDLNKNLKGPNKIVPGVKTKDNIGIKAPSDVKKNKTDEKIVELKCIPSKSEEPSTSSAITTTNQKDVPLSTLQQASNVNSLIDSCSHKETKTLDISDKQVVLESQDIPNIETKSNIEINIQKEVKTGEDNKAENIAHKDDEQEKPTEIISAPKRPVKEEKAVKVLIATPRPLQKKMPQVIHSSDSSDSSTEEESSEEDDDSESSGESTEFFECDNNPDGRTSTGSNDSGFDSSAPASPATFSQIKKDCDVNCHRKCEKLTANLCGVNQRLLVEALASRTASKKGGEASATTSSSTPAQYNNTDIVEQELEQSTAYDIFRKTGRFTPPARSIPRFRKYTIEDFQFIKVLGKGSFGKVLLAELRDTEYYYAVKCLKKDVVLEDDDVECTLIERKVLALGTNHPYLCHLFATFQTDSHLFFVMEYLNGGDLMFHIQQSGRFPEARARFYAAEIVSGLKFLHKRGIVYRDLKLDNILLDFEGHVRIADFGMCKLQIYLDKTADTFCGTPDYMAPEIIKGLKYNQTVDWWSFGVLLYEMLIGQSPFSGCDEDELFWSICNEMPSYPRFLSHEALTILTRLLDKDARTRLGGTECMYGDIRDQEFFHPIHWDRLDRRELEAPFRPRVRHPMDTQYFDRAFTGERPRLTAVEPHVLRSMDQEPFRGFSYTNPNTTDR